MAERGVIRNRKYAQQIRDFSKLRFGKITPTDIDAFLDFQDKVFIFIESKYKDSQLPYGQRLALERLADSTWKSGKHTLLIIASHVKDGDIEYSSCMVRELRWQGKKYFPKNKTAKQVIDSFIKKYL